MWEVTGAKAHELRGESLWSPEDAETLHRIVDHRDWQAKMLPKIAKPPGSMCMRTHECVCVCMKV